MSTVRGVTRVTPLCQHSASHTCPSYLTLSLHYHIYTITLQCIVNTGILPSILPLPIWQVLPNIYISSSGFKVHDPIFKIRWFKEKLHLVIGNNLCRQMVKKVRLDDTCVLEIFAHQACEGVLRVWSWVCVGKKMMDYIVMKGWRHHQSLMTGAHCITQHSPLTTHQPHNININNKTAILCTCLHRQR